MESPLFLQDSVLNVEIPSLPSSRVLIHTDLT